MTTLYARFPWINAASRVGCAETVLPSRPCGGWCLRTKMHEQEPKEVLGRRREMTKAVLVGTEVAARGGMNPKLRSTSYLPAYLLTFIYRCLLALLAWRSQYLHIKLEGSKATQVYYTRGHGLGGKAQSGQTLHIPFPSPVMVIERLDSIVNVSPGNPNPPSLMLSASPADDITVLRTTYSNCSHTTNNPSSLCAPPGPYMTDLKSGYTCRLSTIPFLLTYLRYIAWSGRAPKHLAIYSGVRTRWSWETCLDCPVWESQK